MTIAVLVYLGFGILIFFSQRTIMYFPVPERHAQDLAVEYLDNAGVSLKLWVVNPGRSEAVIYFGGNAEDVYYNAADFRQVLPNRTVYLVNYRGYGGSGGSPSEQALFADALEIHDRLAERHARIDVIGRSLGSGVAVYLASQRPIARLVLVTAHDSAVSLARSLYPIYPVSLLLWDKYESTRYAAHVTTPTLLVNAEHDGVVPPRHSTRLAEAFPPAVVTQVVIPDAGHNDLSLHPEYWQRIAGFLLDGMPVKRQ